MSKTPLRVSFFGGGTDYPEYFADNPSAVMGGTINKYIYTTGLPLAPFAEQKFRISYKVVEDCNTVDDISHPVIREVLREMDYDTPTGLYTVSDIPGSTGLGSSSAFTVGFYNLVNAMQGNPNIGDVELANRAIHLEREILGENVGVQDQVHAAVGGLAHYEFGVTEWGYKIDRTPIWMSPDRWRHLNQSMVLVYTKIQRHASKIVSAQIKQTVKGDNGVYLNTMYEMATEGKDILEDSGDHTRAFRALGDLLNQGWLLKQKLGKGVTNADVNDIYNTGIDMGAWGGKLLGAGGGGFVMFLLDPELIPAFQKEFGTNNVIPVSFVESRSTTRAV